MVRAVCCFFCVVLMLHVSGCAAYTAAQPQTRAVLIDPGHGGFDGGTVATDGTNEKHINLSISLLLRDLLAVCGVKVDLTRDTDVALEDASAASIREKKVSDMRNRLTMYDSADLVISIHQNHFSVAKYHGTQVFYSDNHHDSQLLATTIRASVIRRLQPENKRELKKANDGIYLLHHTMVPTVLVECGFLSNKEEEAKLMQEIYRQEVARSIVQGVVDWQALEIEKPKALEAVDRSGEERE